MDATTLLQLAQWMEVSWQTLWAGSASAADIRHDARSRLEALVRTAAERSPFYASHLKGRFGRGDVDLADLPSVDKHTLMARFDDWCTDRAVQRATVDPHLNDLSRLGRPLLGRYQVWTSSGTSGVPGVFVQDLQAVAVYDALETVRFRRLQPAEWPAAACMIGERYALLAATGGHFAGCASVSRLARINPMFARAARLLSVLRPVSDLAREMQSFQPTLIASYPTVAQVLAEEQRAGRLALHPREYWTGGEFLSSGTRASIESTFGCRVRNSYGASEFLSIACDCDAKTLHVNNDWVIVEPVDKHGRPTPPGVVSHTTLITNLANSVQPLIRYDIGDRVSWLAEPCACGSALPAIRVEGRTDDILEFADARGRMVPLLPMALATALEDQAGVYGFQLAQRDKATIELRLDPCDAERGEGVDKARAALTALLRAHGLRHVKVAWENRRPRRTSSGKLRRVVALNAYRTRTLK